ncbi:MAG: hypothetical protein BGO31_05920 [Bacteroidetes bacterium 43-16]|nr:MAG: hypothetical protein BGO31_05920 [Bacteroidetes bacterium 43-16]
MKKTFFVLFGLMMTLFSSSVSYGQNGKVHYTSTKTVNAIAEDQKEIHYTYKVFKNNDGSFGYEILANGKTYFYQPNYPGRTEGFAEKKTCDVIATLVIKKINSGKMIPAVNDRELDAYGLKK